MIDINNFKFDEEEKTVERDTSGTFKSVKVQKFDDSGQFVQEFNSRIDAAKDAAGKKPDHMSDQDWKYDTVTLIDSQMGRSFRKNESFICNKATYSLA